MSCRECQASFDRDINTETNAELGACFRHLDTCTDCREILAALAAEEIGRMRLEHIFYTAVDAFRRANTVIADPEA